MSLIFLKCRKNDEIRLSNDSGAIRMALTLLGLRIHSLVHLLTYLLTQLARGV